jgi:hypothetical protein
MMSKRKWEDDVDIDDSQQSLQESMKKVRIAAPEASVYLSTQLTTKTYYDNTDLGKVIQTRINEREQLEREKSATEDHYSQINHFLGSLHKQRHT